MKRTYQHILQSLLLILSISSASIQFLNAQNTHAMPLARTLLPYWLIHAPEKHSLSVAALAQQLEPGKKFARTSHVLTKILTTLEAQNTLKSKQVAEAIYNFYYRCFADYIHSLFIGQKNRIILTTLLDTIYKFPRHTKVKPGDAPFRPALTRAIINTFKINYSSLFPSDKENKLFYVLSKLKDELLRTNDAINRTKKVASGIIINETFHDSDIETFAKNMQTYAIAKYPTSSWISWVQTGLQISLIGGLCIFLYFISQEIQKVTKNVEHSVKTLADMNPKEVAGHFGEKFGDAVAGQVAKKLQPTIKSAVDATRIAVVKSIDTALQTAPEKFITAKAGANTKEYEKHGAKIVQLLLLKKELDDQHLTRATFNTKQEKLITYGINKTLLNTMSSATSDDEFNNTLTIAKEYTNEMLDKSRHYIDSATKSVLSNVAVSLDERKKLMLAVKNFAAYYAAGHNLTPVNSETTMGLKVRYFGGLATSWWKR